MNIIVDSLRKIKRQYLNFSLMRAATLRQYFIHIPLFCLYYFLGRGRIWYPLNVTLDLTYDCNLNCGFCFLNFSAELKAIKKESLSYEEIRKIVFSLSCRKTTFFLTGGEVTLRSDLPDIVKMIKDNGFRCGIFTNAVQLTPPLSDALIAYGLDYMFFSLDGPRDIHNNLRASGVFDKVCSNIAYIAKKAGPRMKIIMNVLIVEQNYKRLPEVIDIAYGLGVNIVAFDFLTFLTPEEFLIHKAFIKKEFSADKSPSLVYVRDFKEEVRPELFGIIEDAIKSAKHKKIHIVFKPDLTKAEMNSWFESDFKLVRRCIYPWNVIRIAPDGNVYPCAQFCFSVGNVRQIPLGKLWNSRRFCEFRRILRNMALLPGCNRCVKL